MSQSNHNLQNSEKRRSCSSLCSSFLCHTSSHSHSSHAPGLCACNALSTFCPSSFQQKLWDLSGFATRRLSNDHRHRVGLHQIQYLSPTPSNRQSPSLFIELQSRVFVETRLRATNVSIRIEGQPKLKSTRPRPTQIHLQFVRRVFAMASVLQSVWRRNLFRFGPTLSQPRRWEGNLPITTNKYIEEWSARRERLEEEFRFSPRNVVILGLTCVAFPVLLFKLTILQLDYADDANGRARRRFWPRDKMRDY